MTKFAEGAAAAFLEAWDLKWVGCWIGENTVDGSDGSDQISWNVKYSIWQGFILVIPEPSTVWKTLRKGGTEADSGTGAIVSSAAGDWCCAPVVGISQQVSIIAVDKGMGNWKLQV